MSTLEVNKITPSTGTSITLGDSGDTFTIPSGVTLTNNGTDSGFGGVNTPSFRAYQGSTQSVSTDTLTTLQLNTENYDTDGCYDTGTYRFTPTVSGKYFLYACQRFTATGNYDVGIDMEIRKNGSSIARFSGINYYTDSRFVSTVETLNGSTDFVEVTVYQSSGISLTLDNGQSDTFFGGYKIIE